MLCQCPSNLDNKLSKRTCSLGSRLSPCHLSGRNLADPCACRFRAVQSGSRGKRKESRSLARYAKEAPTEIHPFFPSSARLPALRTFLSSHFSPICNFTPLLWGYPPTCSASRSFSLIFSLCTLGIDPSFMDVLDLPPLLIILRQAPPVPLVFRFSPGVPC